MADNAPIEVSRHIAAPAHDIFAVLADPRRHPELDGSGMVLSAVTDTPVTAVGDVFVVAMQSRKWGSYEMDNHIVEFDPDVAIGWEPQAGRGHPDAGAPRLGHRWIYRLAPDDTGTLVTEIYDCTVLAAEDRAEMSEGRLWIPAMEGTLERLDALCTSA
jgi:hypothetical protein